MSNAIDSLQVCSIIKQLTFRESSLRVHKRVPNVDLVNRDYSHIGNILTINSCYLQQYAKNLSCITPLAYGEDLRIISLRRKSGEILHLINPSDPISEEKDISILESNTLFPHSSALNVTRPKILTLSYLFHDLNTSKTERFELGDAFCIKSSLDLFNHILPPFTDETTQITHNHAE